MLGCEKENENNENSDKRHAIKYVNRPRRWIRGNVAIKETVILPGGRV